MSATPANGKTPPTTRRSALPPPFGLEAISEDLTASQRELMAIRGREEARDKRDAEVNAKLGLILSALGWIKWGTQIVLGAMLLACAGGIVALMVRGIAVVPKLIGGGP